MALFHLLVPLLAQHSSVIVLVVMFRSLELLTVTYWELPENDKALPILPLVVQVAPVIVPLSFVLPAVAVS